MKTRIRQMPNDRWVLEGRRWYHLRWHGVYVDESMNVKAASWAGKDFVPVVRCVAPGSLLYTLSWHADEHLAKRALKYVLSISGGE